MHHPYGIAGLVANMLGTAMLLYFPPDLKGYQPDGSQRAWWTLGPIAAGKREYRKLRDGFKLGFWLLFLGFFLQFLDLLVG